LNASSSASLLSFAMMLPLPVPACRGDQQPPACCGQS
jgi:hypothetical protein